MKRQGDFPDRPLPPRVPRTELYSYPTQLYFLILKMPMSRSSELVEKLGNNTVKIQRNGQIIKLSQEEYYSLEPVNPSRFGRFAGQGGAERRDEALELGLRFVLNQNRPSAPDVQSFLTAEDIAALAQTNRTALEQALSSNANNFKESQAARAQFLSAIRRGDMETVALFEKYQAPIYDVDESFFHALVAAVEGGHNELFQRLYRKVDRMIMAADFLMENYGQTGENWRLGNTGTGNQAIFEAIIRTRNIVLLRFMIDELPDEISGEGVEWILFKISELNWADAVPYVLSMNPGSTFYSQGGSLIHYTPLAFWVKRKNLRMITLILQSRPPHEQRFMLKCFTEGEGNAITEALKLGRDGLDIVQFCLSRSVKGDSVCCFGQNPDAILTAIHYTDPLGNIIEAPFQVVADIVRDYTTNVGGTVFSSSLGTGLRWGGLSPLIACCRFREDNPVECARLLLDAGADINETHKETGLTTPLLEACRRNNLPLARFLLDSGANPNLANPTQILGGYKLIRPGVEDIRVRQTPLLVAAVLRNRELVDLLLTRGANPSERIGIRERPDEDPKLVDFLSALNAYGINYRYWEILKFLILEKGFRTSDEKFIQDLSKLVKNYYHALGKQVWSQQGGRMLFLIIHDIPGGQRRDILKRLVHNLIDEEDIDIASAYLELFLTIEPDLISTEDLFDAIAPLNDSRKVALLLSKISIANLRRTIFYRGFNGTALDYAKHLRENFHTRTGAFLELKLENLLSTITMIERKIA